FCAFLVIFPLLSLPWSQAGNILVFPVDGSYWLNMKLLIEGLHARGHNISVVRSSTSWYIKEKCPQYTSITIHLPEALINGRQDFLEAFLHRMLDIHWGEGSLRWFTSCSSQQPFTSGEAHSVAAPSPVSYVPTSRYAASDKMIFTQRLQNILHFIKNVLMERLVFLPPYNELSAAYFGPDTDFYHLWQSADIWLMRADFVSEFPSGYIGGFQCKPSKPLPSELEDFVQSSGEHTHLKFMTSKVTQTSRPSQGRGAAKVLNVIRLPAQSFPEAIKEVIHKPSYSKNMQRLSRLRWDKPLMPPDNAYFWMEFVMGHKVAAHLHRKSYKMPWYVSHSLDVISFLLAVVLLLVFTLVCTFSIICHWVCKRRKHKIE
uniref:Si:ch73-334d15.1 n=1 Tax=Paramormyrops kingsleyae TaxID=1676925 RepID=A0A3B3R5Q1_9TELE